MALETGKEKNVPKEEIAPQPSLTEGRSLGKISLYAGLGLLVTHWIFRAIEIIGSNSGSFDWYHSTSPIMALYVMLILIALIGAVKGHSKSLSSFTLNTALLGLFFLGKMTFDHIRGKASEGPVCIATTTQGSVGKLCGNISAESESLFDSLGAFLVVFFPFM